MVLLNTMLRIAVASVDLLDVDLHESPLDEY